MFLTEEEIRHLLVAAKQSKYGTRDHLMILMVFRHAFRVSELIDVRISDLDLEAGRIFVSGSRRTLRRLSPFLAMSFAQSAPSCDSGARRAHRISSLESVGHLLARRSTTLSDRPASGRISGFASIRTCSVTGDN
ncbi:MAG: tyrosine-type recombinase/integrase [Acidobacteria bacterium]|nr:tyrosine-type recombinase/integrase [Acidobacteriota bacterium]